jgi:hypothetical protein
MEKHKRALLFLLACIPIRLLFVYLAKTFTNGYAQIAMGVIGTMIGLGFINAYKNHVKFGFFGGKAWWHDLRIIHAFNYLVFGLSTLIYRYEKAYMMLLFDVLLGIIGYFILQ